jgi:vitamin B12 transporter
MNNVTQKFYLIPGLALLSHAISSGAVAQSLPDGSHLRSQGITTAQYKLNRPSQQAELLQPEAPQIIQQQQFSQTVPPSPVDADRDEEEVIVEGQAQPKTSSPFYVITEEELKKRGARSLTEALKNLPGFAIHDSGFAADIHTGFYYRGTTLNQNKILLNGRSIGSNVNLYHGATDLNSLLTGDIERIELSSGTASTLYGSEAFGGVVNVITKEGGSGPAQFNALVQAGSYGQQQYRGGVSGTLGSLSYTLGYERSQAENNYPVPKGAANRDAQGRLFNADATFNNYAGRLSYKIDARNTVSVDAYKITSRKGLIYFGFPLQRDRLDHDALNLGLSWKALVGAGKDSVLTATVGYNKDEFKTYGPTRNIFFRTGSLDSRGLTARVEHQWQVSPIYNLRYGVDHKTELFDGETVSNVPQLVRFNETENRDRSNTALFALNTFQILDNFQFELGIRHNINSNYGNYTDPSFGIRWALTPKLSLRGSWASVRRIPGLDQLYLYDTVHGWLPNASLKPEIGSTWTGGIDLALSKAVTVQLTYFGNSLENRLGIVAGRWANINLVDTNGLEAAARWQITPQFSALANYTYTDAKIKDGADAGRQLSTVPFSVAQLSLGYESNGWQVNLYASYNSGSRRALFTDSGVSPKDFSPSWLNLDLNARIPLFKNVGLLVYLENLANVSYEKVNRIYQPGLTFRIGLSATF